MKVGIYIGRFQPLHIGHITIINYMQTQYDHLIILVGSANQASSLKNPFSFEMRQKWLKQSFDELAEANETGAKKISILPLNDYPDDEKKWEAGLNEQVLSATSDDDKITLVGHEKDDSSYYLKSFPQWGYDSVPQSIKISATPIRNAWFTDKLDVYSEFLPAYVAAYLTSETSKYTNLFEDYHQQEIEDKKPSTSKRRIKKILVGLLCLPLIVILLGFIWPEAKMIPVKNALKGDWAANSFWFEPWGTSGVHKGIDIFARKGTDLLSTNDGIVIGTGNWKKGGKHIFILGPKWRVHYYAHLGSIDVKKYELVSAGQKIGTVGNSGNAKGKPAHLHYTIVTLYPRPWAITEETQGARKAYYLDPHIYLTE